MKKVFRTIDAVNERIGLALRWVVVALVVICVTEVILRFVFLHPTQQGPHTMMMVGASLYALAWGYIYLHDAHVRVDVLYARQSQRGKVIIDAVCALVLFFPMICLVTYGSIHWTWYAWEKGEKLVETFWYPPSAPVRTVVSVGLVLFLLQGIVRFVRDLYFAVKGKTL
jgi:TRAP-type mannitol/chloroaromatic compound transport system permease small subunit